MDRTGTDKATPTRLGRYEVIGVLGRGAMGDVYWALDPTIDRRVAIKTLDKRSRDPAVVARFLSEARAVGRLVHPNIVQVYDAAEQDDVAYMVMELVEGSSLQDYLSGDHEVPLDDVVSIITELLDALGYAHARGIVHRDVKPSNVMLAADTGKVKLTDFGVAYVDDSVHRTNAGTVIGTPTYMSPEQVQGKPVSAASDQFAVGLLLYRMLTGRNAFSGDSVLQLAYSIVQEQPPAPSTLVGGLSPRFDDVVLRALEKDPARRHASAHEFAAEVRRAAAAPGAGWLSRLASAWRRTTARGELAESPPADASPSREEAIAADMTVIRPVAADSSTPEARGPQPPSAQVVGAAPPAPAAADSTMVLAAGILRPPSGEAATAQLVVTTSSDARAVGRTFPITHASFVIGRDPAADVALLDDFCSRRHALIERRDGAYVLVDTSANGTLLNGRKVDRNTPPRLLFGATIRIGDTTLTFTHVRDTTLPDLVGQLLASRYRLRELRRQSAKASVYAAQVEGFGGWVAVKLLSADLASYPGYRDQFEQEARLAMQMQHPHICQVLDHGVADLELGGKRAETPFLVYELMRGGSLARRLADRDPPDVDRVTRWTTQIAAALTHAHQQGVVHGNLKPTAVCFDAEDNAYLTDFAFAGATGGNGVLLGAPAFMAPEQWAGEPASPASDQFALAALCYALVTGSRPFTGQEDPKTRERNFRRPPVPAHEEAKQNDRPEIARGASDVLQRALATDPAQRHASVDAFARAFDAALHHRLGSAGAPTVFVSYQHEPSAGWAVLLARDLKEKYKIAAFVDTQRLDGAVQFPDKVARAIEHCEVFVCLLADTTLSSRWVREEIKLAHAFGRPMIPVFQESFKQQEREALDPSIEALLHYDGVHLLDRRNIHIDHSIADLARLVNDTMARRQRDE